MKKEIVNIVKKSTNAVRQSGADETKNAFDVFRKQFENFSKKNNQDKIQFVKNLSSIQ
jgi:hypothetical protein